MYPRRFYRLILPHGARGERGTIMYPRPVCIIFFLVLVAVSAGYSEIPQMIGYQGMVTDAAGDPVADGDYSMRFRLYNAATGGTELWDSGVQTVGLNNGIFNVLLGENPQPSLDLAFDEDLWLLVTFSGVNQLPRQRIVSTAYAYMASGLVPGTLVIGERSGMFQPALNGTNTATSGVNFGLSGYSYSNSGAGVFGYGYATTGTNYGLYGQSDSPAGYGIFGYNPGGWAGGFDGNVTIDGRLELTDNDATPTIGSGAIQIGDASRALRLDGNEIITNTGELLHLQRDNAGRLSVDDGTFFVDGSIGKVGIGTDTPEEKFHVVNTTAGEAAIKGESTSSTGASYGGYFTIATSANTAKSVYGAAVSTTGTTYGGWFESYSSSGTGVRGRAAATTGETKGVYGVIESPSGIGVYGLSTANSGSPVGVKGIVEASGPLAAGIYGESTAGSGESYGVYGVTESADGEGLVGFCVATTGHNTGVYAQTFSTNGNGVLGYASATEGLCVGVVGETNSDAGYGVFYIGGIAGSGKMKSFQPAAGGHVALGIHATAGDWVEYFGEATLSNGMADVQLDPLFLETVTVDEEHPMKVFIQLHDETSRGVAVKKSRASFTAIELDGGRSNGSFDYRVVASRKGYEDTHLEAVRELPATTRAIPPVLAE